MKAHWDSGYDGYNTVIVNGVTIQNNQEITLRTGDYIQTGFGECLERNTLIMLANGAEKKVCELAIGDMVLCLNPYTMEVEVDEVVFTDSGILKEHNKSDIWTFSDGTELKTVHPHQIYNCATNQMEYLADFRIGDEARKMNGTTTALVSHRVKHG